MKTNLQTRKLLTALHKAGKSAPVWKQVAAELERPTRQHARVNISKIDRYVRDGETAVIPGKVLSLGNTTKKISVAAFQFSDIAKEKVRKSGQALSIAELLEKNPKGNKVRIIK